jgi:hypothetical protein
MRRVFACVLLAASSAAVAQEGFPLDGTWRGERNVAGGSPASVVFVIQWDGQQVTGVVNPGPRSLTIKEGRLDPEGWKVSLVAESGKGQKATFEGTLEEIGSYHRFVNGTWTEGGRSYSVRMVRE